MNVRALLCILCLAGLPVLGQSFAGLGDNGDGYAQVTADSPLVFPADHGAHPDFRIEWWYVTANLETEDGTQMGLQWTLFRQAGQPNDTGTGWQSRQIWMGHAGLTTPNRHFVGEIFARGGIGQAGVRIAPFEAWIDDWRMAGPDFDDLLLSANGPGFSYDVKLSAYGPLIRHGQDGFAVKSETGQASYYYSQPHYSLSGSVTIDGKPQQVTGTAWLDREWSSQQLSGDQTGWDWFSLHLDSGEKVMLARIRSLKEPHFSAGTWIENGQATQIANGAIVFSPLETSDVGGRDIPTSWRLKLPERGLDVEVRALNPQSFMTTLFPYWEGPVSISGSHTGVGYLEMTGYE